MTKEDIKGYTNRIIQANKSELIVILYDIVLQDLQEAQEYLTESKERDYQKSCNHCLRAVNELMVSLDFKYEISVELFRLYRYVNEVIAKAKTTKDASLLANAYHTMNKLRTSFIKVASEDHSEPVMKNTEQVYAGLTYNKGDLNESLLNASTNRGFKV